MNKLPSTDLADEVSSDHGNTCLAAWKMLIECNIILTSESNQQPARPIFPYLPIRVPQHQYPQAASRCQQVSRQLTQNSWVKRMRQHIDPRYAESRQPPGRIYDELDAIRCKFLGLHEMPCYIFMATNAPKSPFLSALITHYAQLCSAFIICAPFFFTHYPCWRCSPFLPNFQATCISGIIWIGGSPFI